MWPRTGYCWFCRRWSRLWCRLEPENPLRLTQLGTVICCIPGSNVSLTGIQGPKGVGAPSRSKFSAVYEIQNLRVIELEAIQEKWLSTVEARVNALGQRLQREADRKEMESRLARIMNGREFSSNGKLTVNFGKPLRTTLMWAAGTGTKPLVMLGIRFRPRSYVGTK